MITVRFLTYLLITLSVHPLTYNYATSTPIVAVRSLQFTTIHGELTIDDPLAIELIQSPVMQRLKGIMQYGVNEFVTPGRYAYTRFDHCLAVYQLLKQHGASRSEQIAGLLHDASHTVFSHTTEPLFMGGFDKGNYQDKIHEEFLNTQGVAPILVKYGLNVTDVLPDRPEFRALEQNSPALCADRIEYIIHAGDLTEQLSPKEIRQIHDALHFDGQDWYFDNAEVAEKFARVSIEQTLNNWGHPMNIILANYVCAAIKCLRDNNQITNQDIHFTLSDRQLWHLLQTSKLNEVKELMVKVNNLPGQYAVCEQGKENVNVKTKFRGVNPFVKIGNKLYLLTELSPAYKSTFNKAKNQLETGWHLRISDKNSPLLRTDLKAG